MEFSLEKENLTLLKKVMLLFYLVYVFSEKHSLFSSLTFGDQKKGIFTGNSDPSDSLEGCIFEVNEGFKEEFMEKS